MGRKKCEAPNCGRLAVARGYCSKHYYQVRTHGGLTPDLERKGKIICKSPGCHEETHARGYCSKHYQQVIKYGRLTPELERGKI